jgi:hypothetical protein
MYSADIESILQQAQALFIDINKSDISTGFTR